MKKTILSFFILPFIIISNLNAQFGVGSPKVLDAIKKSKLMVVLYDDEAALGYNENIKEYVEKNWKYGEYEFIDYDNLEDFEKREDLFFLAMTISRFGTSALQYSNPGISISSRSKEHYLWGDRAIAATVPVSLSLLNNTSEEHFRTILKVLFDVLDNYEKKDLKLVKGKKVAKYYNPKTEVSSFKNKTLLIPHSSISTIVDVAIMGHVVKTNDKYHYEDELAKYYTKDFKIVKEGELGEYIKEDDGQYIYLHAVEAGPSILYYLFDIKQNKLVYYNNMPEGMVMTGATNTRKTFKKMLKNLDELMN